MTLSVDVSARLSLNKNLCSKSDVSTVYLVVIYVPSKTSMESKLTELPNLNLCISFAVTKL